MVRWDLSISVPNLSEIVIRPFIIFQTFYKTKLQNKNTRWCSNMYMQKKTKQNKTKQQEHWKQMFD